ncbi:MAG: hypothetical protein R3D00_26355 [Bacteroidia bacterium]
MDSPLHLTIPLSFNQLFDLIKQLPVQDKKRLLSFLLINSTEDAPLTHLAAESTLAKDWNKPEEDLAWENL